MLLDGICEVADTYDHFILDIYGVIHDGIRPFPGTLSALRGLKDKNKRVCLLSNSPRRTHAVSAHLQSMGIARDLYDHIVTSGEATWQALQNRDPTLGDDCWFIGTPHGSEVLEGQSLNIHRRPEGASFILNSIPGTEGRERTMLMAALEYAAKKGLPMICANPDLVVNIGSEQYECAGTFAALYEGMGGAVTYHGKPHGPVYEQCYRLFGSPDKSRMCAVGDSFHTDIAGANRFGIASVLNLAGIHWEEVQTRGRADPARLKALLGSQETHPTHMIAGFSW
jgi:HAD superfamily hydrolase (TIGR01459 family)